MGKTQSTQQQSFSIKIKHPKLHQTKLLKQDNIMRAKIDIQNQSDFLLWEQRLNNVTKIDDQVLLLPKAYQYTRRAICGSAGLLEVDYDFYEYLLADQLKNRRKCKRYFQQSEIWYLLYSLVSAAHNFYNLNQKIGDVRPENIFINEDGHIKISNLYSWPLESTNFLKTQISNQKTYLSPEQLDMIKQGKTQGYINKLSSESFSIGLTILQSGMLQNLSNLYLSDKRFDMGRLQNILREWWTLVYKQIDEEHNKIRHKQYSQALKLTLVGLCQINPKNRLTSEQVYQWLKPFHQQINILCHFQPNLPPVNMNNYSPILNSNRKSKTLTNSNPRDWGGHTGEGRDIEERIVNPNINKYMVTMYNSEKQTKNINLIGPNRKDCMNEVIKYQQSFI